LDVSRPETTAVLRRLGIAALPSAGPLYRVRAFEVRRALVAADVWLWEEDLLQKRPVLAIGDQDLILKLRDFGVELEALEVHSMCDYPI
jgi:hypothetical protein